MAAPPYWYLIPYQDDPQEALDGLRAREFAAGRYHPVLSRLDFSPSRLTQQYRKAQHDSIEDAIMDAGEDGTRSILDIHRVAKRPDFGVATEMPRAALTELYGTDRPTEHAVRANKDFLRWTSPAQCIYLTVYDAHGAPQQYLFAGRSFG